MSAHFSLFQSFPRLFHSVGAQSPDPSRTISLHQIHGTSIIQVDKRTDNNLPADGMITHENGIYLAIHTADCIPIFLFDPQTNAIGLIHAGWRGVDKGIHNQAILELKQAYNSHPRDIIVGLGPGICPKCYFFKESPRQVDQPRWKPFINQNDRCWHVDLKRLIKSELLAIGIKREHIEDMNICTYENQKFPSHRRTRATSEPEGRIVSIIALKNEVVD